MKKLFLLFSLLCAACSGAPDKVASDSSLSPAAAKIESRLPQLKESERISIVFAPNEEGTLVTAYRDGHTIVKIATEPREEAGKKQESFYFSHHQLLFAHVITTSYNGTLDEELRGKKVLHNTVVGNDQLVFENGKLVHWWKSGVEVQPGTTDYSEVESDILARAASYKAFMNTPEQPSKHMDCWTCKHSEHNYCMRFVCEP